MTLSTAMALLGAMVILAAIPSISVLAVSTRAASAGLIHGIFTAIGIVVGDIVFIVIAIWGLSFLAETMGNFFAVIKYGGGAYLIWLGIGLWRSPAAAMDAAAVSQPSLLSSFLTGLLITLADQKAIFFYLGFFPAFLDLEQMTLVDTGLIIAIAIVAVGGVKLGYALLGDRARWLMRSQARQLINRGAGAVMMAVGLFLIVKA